MILLGWMMISLSRSVRLESRNIESKMFKYPHGIRRFFLQSWVIVAVLGSIIYREEGVLGVVTIFSIFAVILIPANLEFGLVQVRWDEEKIFTQSPWRPNREIPLNAVERCDFSESLQWYRIYCGDMGIVRLSSLGCGSAELLSRLPCEVPDRI